MYMLMFNTISIPIDAPVKVKPQVPQVKHESVTFRNTWRHPDV